MNKIRKITASILAIATLAAGMTGVTANAGSGTSGPYYTGSTDGTYTYKVKFQTSFDSSSAISRNIDGYNQISKARHPQIFCVNTGSFLVSRVIAALPQDGEGIRAAA